ncbi:crotonase/enoyl-CoA hydratase family protein [Paraglaciecola sp. L3A3]|uniref:crotonase/enoyl-CoA hydratase family protein n=1 Tax=Paraglaciecola sp. L3A3 TaxID=2686358 RepID=UPI00131CB991|nr:crotonase/enoyl-CoA hydratase family protein [Paraglaciecola sp. L3A3]
MSELVHYQIDNNVATITLQNGKANAISHEVIVQLNLALDKAEEQQAVVVLTGQAGMLSAGYDLKVMTESMQSAMKLVEQGSTLARRMLAFPLPIVVACTGHAVAKGAFLCLSADYRIGLEGQFKVGLNEVAIGMEMHHVGVELARARLTPAYFNRCVLLADMLSPTEAVIAGFLDKAVSEAEFMSTVLATAQALTKLNMQAHHKTKLKARAELLRVLDESILKDASTIN